MDQDQMKLFFRGVNFSLEATKHFVETMEIKPESESFLQGAEACRRKMLMYLEWQLSEEED